MSWLHHLSVRNMLCACAGLLLLSCFDSRRGPTEADLSAFGKYVYAFDTLEMNRHIGQILAADTSSFWGEADKVVHEHYATHQPFEALWFTRMGLSADADSLLVILRHELPLNGLDTTAFHINRIAEALSVTHALAFDSLGLNINEVLTQLDYHLSQAFIRYAVGQRYGFTRPDKLLNRLDLKSEGGYARLFDFTLYSPNYREAMQALAADQRIEYLRASSPSSPLYLTLQQQLSKTADADKRRTLAINLERCRWPAGQPESKGRRILVNIPAQQLWAIGPDTTINMRICCGTTVTKTPLLQSAITHIEVNPAWIIPQTIIKAEISAHAGDSAYFARHRYSIINRSTGQALNPANVTAQQLRAGGLRVSQRGGAGNSLGRIIFRVPNDFAVYLHDTSSRGAFQRERRTLSHGCIRVQKPFELATFVLPDADEWTLERLRLSMDIPPVSDRGRKYLSEHATNERPLRLITHQNVNPHIPVDITYFTAFPNPETGTVEFWPDLYNFDTLLSRHLPLQK